jgi:signal peptidase I
MIRAARLLLVAGVLVTLWLFLRGRGTVTIPEDDSSMEPTFPAGSTLMAESLDAGAPVERGTHVLFRARYEGKEYERIGTVRGLPGDEVGARDGLLTVNGEWVGPLKLPGEAMGVVPPGHLLILASNPMARRYLDSRNLGFVPRADVKAVVQARVN